MILSSYLAAGPVCAAAGAVATSAWRDLIVTLALWACVAAFVPYLPPGADPLCTVNTRPMLRSRDPAPLLPAPTELPLPNPDPPEAGRPAVEVLPLEGVVSLGVDTGAGPCWLGAGVGQALWHSARVMKLLLFPWQLPNQKWTHLEVRTS